MEAIQYLLPQVIKKLGIEKKILEASVLHSWQEIVGDEISKHACPEKIEQGVLWLRVDQPVWSHHLMLLKFRLLERINNRAGKKVLHDIRFLAGKISLKPKDSYLGLNQESRIDFQPVELSQDEYQLIQQAVQHVENDLQPNFQRLMLTTKQIYQQKKESGYVQCVQCGVWIEPHQEICGLCWSKNKQSKQTMIRRLLMDMPWLTYEQAKLDEVDDGEYEQARQGLIREIYQKLRLARLGHNQNVLKNEWKQWLYIYVMLIKQCPLTDLTVDIVKNTVGYRLYQFIMEKGD